MSQIDEVRAAADIVKIVGDYVKLRKAGANMIGLCPFHSEKTPSFAVHPAKQIFHCFGCGVGGDSFKFVMLIENLTFPEALRRVAEKVGITLRETGGEGFGDKEGGARAALLKIHEVAVKFYASQLGATAEGRTARAYLADRGLEDETVGQFRLGYAPADGQAVTRHLAAAGFDSEIAERSGLVLRDTESGRRYDRFRRRVIFPISNESGKVVAFGGRALGDDQPKYLNSPETPIYTKGRVLFHLHRAGPAIRRQDYAILVEGYMDCIAVASAGLENVIASCGTSLTESQARLLARFSRRVVVNYDPDSAGIQATERSLSILLEEGFEAKVLALPKGLDPDSFVRHEGAAAYRQRLAVAPTYLDYLTDRAASQQDLTRPEGKVAAANSVMPFLVKVPNPMLRAELATRLAERLHLDERLMREELRRAAGERRGEVHVRAEAATLETNPAVKQLIRAFLENDELANEFLAELVESGDCQGLAGEQLFKRLYEHRLGGEKMELEAWVETLSPEDQKLVYECLFWPGETLDRERCLGSRRALRLKRMQRDRAKLQGEIERAIQESNPGRLGDLQKAKFALDKELHKLGKP